MRTENLYSLIHKKRDNSRYYHFILELWKEYMPSLNTKMSYERFGRLMSQRPSEMDNKDVIWNDLVERGNLSLRRNH